MKKVLSLFLMCSMLFALSTTALAATPEKEPSNTSFEISLEEALAAADPEDVHTQNGVTTIPVTLNVNDEVYTEIVIHVSDMNRATAKSFSMEGWFRLKSNKEIVTVYGLEGTFEYTGSKATPTGSSAYHNSAASGRTGTYNINESEDDNGGASITANYTCYHDGKVDSTGSCTAECTKNGSISFSGNYDESTII